MPIVTIQVISAQTRDRYSTAIVQELSGALGKIFDGVPGGT
ncbi:MAG: hypothetical protein VB957_04960 [Pseudomonadales bacterium]